MRPEKVPKMRFWCFDKSLIHSCVLFILEYESNNVLLTFCKNHISGKNMVIKLMVQKPLDQSKYFNAVGFFKLRVQV